MPKKKKENRLDLDFSIENATDRAQYINKYVSSLPFELNSDEKEMIANYLLWGKDDDGKNPVQKKEIQISTRSKTWDRKELESLDELKESPTFNEAVLHELNTQSARPKIVRKVFQREDVERLVPETEREDFYDLFKRIDYYDALVGYYDYFNGKRDDEPRATLTDRITPEQISQIITRAKSMEEYEYLKVKHLLVELRKDQFAKLDGYKAHLIKKDSRVYLQADEKGFGSDIPVLPLGIKSGEGKKEYLFLSQEELMEFLGDEESLRVVSQEMWRVREQARQHKNVFDFREKEHVYSLILQYYELKYGAQSEDVESTIPLMLSTLEYYVKLAKLDDIQMDILEMKMRKIKNPEIAEAINKKYGTSYTNNYISTIFRQKIVAKIAAAAKYHEQIVENLFFEEKFKRCNTCGRMLLISEENFVHKVRAVDGFANRCKDCDREDREKRRGTE